MKRTFVRIIAGTLAGLAVIAAAASCAKETFVSAAGSNDGLSVKLSLSEEDFTPVSTKAIQASSIKDLAVFQFQNGVLKNQFILEDQAFTGGSLNVTEFISQPVTVLDEAGRVVPGNENIIVFLANMKCNGMLDGSTFTKDVTTYSQFLDKSYKFADADAITNAEFIPMYGTWTQGLTDGVTNSISVTVTRAMAYINFTISTSNFTLPSAEGTLQGTPNVANVKLHNVPLALTLPSRQVRPALPVNQANGVWPDGSADGASAYPAYAAADFVDFDEAAELAQTGNTAATTFQFYVNENARGSFAGIDTYALKKAKTGDPGKSAEANYMAGITYITFDLVYATAEGKEGVASYRINLGGNNTGDFNIRGGAQYNVTTNVYGIGNESERTNIDIRYTFNVVDVTPTTSDAVTVLPDANCYMLQPAKIADNKYDGKTLVLRLTQPRTGWQYVQANEAPTSGNYVTDLQTLIEAGNYTVETLWQTASNTGFSVAGSSAADIMTAGSGVDDKMKNYFVKLTALPQPSANCSALIVLKATADEGTIASGDILWSWHLWFTNYNFDNKTAEQQAAITGTAVATAVGNGETHRYAGAAFGPAGEYPAGLGMMDRNLGATFDVTSLTYEEKSISKWFAEISSAIVTTEGSDFSKLRGMYYQFGRPTPFPQVTSVSGNINSASLVYKSDGSAFTFAEEHTTLPENPLAFGIKHPEKFLSNGTIWWTTPNAGWPQIFDPSPAGWCLPQANSSTEQKNVWWDFGTSDNKYVSGSSAWVANAKGAVYTGIAEKNVYYPASGYVDSTSGAFAIVGSYGFYWSATTSSAASGRYLSFSSTTMYRSYNYNRANAFPVRPVQK